MTGPDLHIYPAGYPLPRRAAQVRARLQSRPADEAAQPALAAVTRERRNCLRPGPAAATLLTGHITARGQCGTASQNVSDMYHPVIPAHLVPNTREITSMRVRNSPSGRYPGPPWLLVQCREPQSFPTSKPVLIGISAFPSI